MAVVHWRMFIRVKRSVQQSGTYEYLQIVESVREGARVRQHVIGNLGRRDQIVADGTLDGLLHSLARPSPKTKKLGISWSFGAGGSPRGPF